MVPISAAMLAPTRPASAIPVSTGPSSIITVLPTSAPDEVEGDGAGEDVGGEEGEDDAGEDGDEERDGNRVHPEPAHLAGEEGAPGFDVGECAGGFEAAAAYVRDEPVPRGDTGCHGGRHGWKLGERAEGRKGGQAAKLASARPTSPSRSRLSARSRSWRTRSRVTPSMPPISSSVCSRPPSRPK